MSRFVVLATNRASARAPSFYRSQSLQTAYDDDNFDDKLSSNMMTANFVEPGQYLNNTTNKAPLLLSETYS